MSGILWLVPLSGVIAVIAATMLARDVLGRPKGTPEMQAVAAAIYEGAMAFLNRQYRTIAMLSVVAAVLIGVLLGAIAPPTTDYTSGELAWRTSVAFLVVPSVRLLPASSACGSRSRRTCARLPPPRTA